MLYVGIDLGTSAVKAILMNPDGNVVSSVSREYPIEFPRAGWSQQSPSDWLTAVKDCLCVLASEKGGDEIAGIGIGGQMHGLVALDEEDNVLRPAILWNDARSAKQTDYLNNVIGKKKLSDLTGNIAFAGFTAPKLLWMRENEPELFDKIDKIMLPKDYIVYMLTGVHSTDMSDASGFLLLDVKNRRWSKEMLDICHVAERQMPRLFESYEAVGEIKSGVARELGLAGGVKVCAGAGDNAAAAVGTGTVGEGRCNISLGTSGTVFITSDSFRLDGNNALHSFAHADGSYHLMACMLSAASCNRWWLEDILKTYDYAAEQSGISDAMLGKNETFWLPYLMGERSPHNDPYARGAFIGMSMSTGRAQMTQAVLEGVAFALRDSLEVARSLGIKISSSKLCGGGAKSAVWQKIIANILNIDLELLEAEEGPSLGGALLAAVACGEFSSVREASARAARVVGIVSPDSAVSRLYDERYRHFSGLYPALREWWGKL